jgi:hypothetical protein
VRHERELHDRHHRGADAESDGHRVDSAAAELEVRVAGEHGWRDLDRQPFASSTAAPSASCIPQLLDERAVALPIAAAGARAARPRHGSCWPSPGRASDAPVAGRVVFGCSAIATLGGQPGTSP